MTDAVTDAVRELTGPIFRLIRRIVGDREEARDLTQDLFVRLLGSSERVRGDLRPYLFRAAFNTALNARRNRGRKHAAHEQLRETHVSPQASGPDLGLEHDETRGQIAEGLAGLAERQREAVTMRFFGELTIAEIAAAMDISEGSVRVHLARGLQKLREHLAPVLDKE